MTAPRYQTSWRAKYARKWSESPAETSEAAALAHVPNNAQTAILRRDGGGKDHPDNAGKFFLSRILR